MLAQIEAHVFHVLESEANAGSESILSGEEVEFAREFAENMDSHFTSLALQHMPANFQKLDRKKTGQSVGCTVHGA